MDVKQILSILSESAESFKSDSVNSLSDTDKRFLVYFYNASCPKGGDYNTNTVTNFHRPGKDDIVGSSDTADASYSSFVMDFAKLKAYLANKKIGEKIAQPEWFLYDTIMVVDKATGDLIGPIENPIDGGRADGVAVKCGVPQTPEQIKQIAIQQAKLKSDNPDPDAPSDEKGTVGQRPKRVHLSDDT